MGVINEADVPIAIQDDNVELRMTEVGDMTVSLIRLKKGTDLSPALVGLPDDLCPCPHWGYMLAGRLKMKTTHGDEVYEAGQPFYWSPGHAPVALDRILTSVSDSACLRRTPGIFRSWMRGT